MLDFDNSYARLPAPFYAKLAPTPVKAPKLLAWNEEFAKQLKIDLEPYDIEQIFSGNTPPPGSDPLAQAYAGHQFGGWSPQLGDGRAILLGELKDQSGARWDLQLKGSGQTPFSRMGDGRAWLGPVLREYVISEAMHNMGVPTTRALAAVGTGEVVLREGPMPGAVLTRVAPSHIRVGTFQYFAARDDLANLEALFNYTRNRHDPDAKDPSAFLEGAVHKQAQLIAKWMGLGFIHGVMNTDNAHVAGITLDYGPCAFMDAFHPMKVFSSIDHMGRYAFSNQPNMAAWNMAQLATALLPLMPDRDAAIEDFTEIVNGFGPLFSKAYAEVFAQKLGLNADMEEEIAPREDAGPNLLSRFLEHLTNHQVDFTRAFYALRTGDRAPFEGITEMSDWFEEWRDMAQNKDAMERANPAIIPRNHRIEEMITAAVDGDMSPFHRLNTALQTPFAPTDPDLMLEPGASEVVQRTFCGT
ncbi:MAG: YdiU family protein [Pseudomonadota bacterium]